VSRRPRVGVRITAGLGNQIFQYAAGLAVARRLAGDLELDTSYYRKHLARPFDLARFGITWAECRVPGYHGLGRAVSRLLTGGRSRFFSTRTEFRERGFAYDGRVERLRGDCYLDGYFQSPLYFADIEGEVRARFDPSRFATSRTAELERRMAGEEHPIAVHVRRGDFAAPPAAKKHTILSAAHYDRARGILEGMLPGPGYFLFSDEPETARGELAHWPRCTLVAGLDRFEELHLMARCRHFIIANSSYSWWAAFLAPAPDKVVIAPRNWFTPRYLRELPTVDLFPEGWILV